MSSCSSSFLLKQLFCLCLFYLIASVVARNAPDDRDIRIEESDDPTVRKQSHRHHRLGQLRDAASRNSRGYRVPQHLLSRKGGIEAGTRRQHLLLTGRVFIAPKLRHLFLTPAGLPNPALDYGSLAVCQGDTVYGPDFANNRTRPFEYFACPLNIPSGEWLRFLDTSGDAYCCGLPGNQTCCSGDTFFLLYGHPPLVSLAIIVTVIGAGLTALLLLAGLLLCLKLRRERLIHSFDRRQQLAKLADPARKPLIPPSPQAVVYPANQQTPIYASQSEDVHAHSQSEDALVPSQSEDVHAHSQSGGVYVPSQAEDGSGLSQSGGAISLK